ncbi:GntR family transcriptional regulator [uncultured Microbacterium sp.]|uniref:GntR family transcriptional regulator n=1 Tax=uncultured Microbacterium sp. TaxID=191216 RepID=UPI0028D835A6|nr:GntR family transcriptional regulator [uncultured Microbacterium sp.]
MPKRLISDAIFESVGTAIVDGRYLPGQRLRSVTIADEFHVSRMPVREALQRLERIGLVEMLPARLTRVTRVTPEVALESIRYAGYQAGFAAHESVPRLSPGDRREALRRVDRAADRSSDATMGSAHRRDVFSFLSARSGNSIHHAHMRDMELAFQRNIAVLESTGAIEAFDPGSWQLLRRAIATGDAAMAESATRALHGLPT